jgi:hypothetical protein
VIWRLKSRIIASAASRRRWSSSCVGSDTKAGGFRPCEQPLAAR